MSNVSIYVVDLRRVQPLAAKEKKSSEGTLKHQQQHHVRRSFARANGQQQRPSVKEDPDAAGSDDGSGSSGGASAAQDITDVAGYESVFRPRRRQLTRTPPHVEAFEAPLSGSENEVVTSPSSLAPSLRTNLRIRNGRVSCSLAYPEPLVMFFSLMQMPASKVSPSPTRRASQPTLSHGYSTPDLSSVANTTASPLGRPVLHTAARARRISQQVSADSSSSSPPTSAGHRAQRAASVQPSSPSSSPPTRDSRAGSVASHRVASTPPATVSRVQIGGPMDGRPAVVRPARVSLQENIEYYDNTPVAYHIRQQQLQQQRLFEEQELERQRIMLQQQHLQQHQPVPSPIDMVPLSQPEAVLTPPAHRPPAQQQPEVSPPMPQPVIARRATSPSKIVISKRAEPSPSPRSTPVSSPAMCLDEKPDAIVPMHADKPSGLELSDFMPKAHAGSHAEVSRFAAYKGYASPMADSSSEPTDSEATGSVQSGHRAMMSVLASRGRNLEIVHKLWQNKDAKTAVDHAVSLNDQAVLVDFLSVITLRPSIWNLDLCTALLPALTDLLQSKYETYIVAGCGGLKVILKNFASVIKTNIDAPVQTVGVDISREER